MPYHETAPPAGFNVCLMTSVLAGAIVLRLSACQEAGYEQRASQPFRGVCFLW